MTVRIIQADVMDGLAQLPDGSVHCCITSPPYWGLRDYKAEGQIGLEKTPDEHIEKLVAVFGEVRRVLRKDGTLWLNMGDTYCGYWGDKKAVAENRPSAADGHGFSMNSRPKYEQFRASGLKPKDLVMMPARLALALQADGWWIRSDIIWAKPNPMPESCTDRPTSSHEHIFLMTKAAKYFCDMDAIREPHEPTSIQRAGRALSPRKDGVTIPQADKRWNAKGMLLHPAGRNKRDVWTIATAPFPKAHFATFPPKLVEPCIKAGTSEKGCCLECRRPWERVVEKTRTFESGSGRSGNMPQGKNGPDMQGGGETLDIRRGPCVTTETTGWRPRCSCPPLITSGGDLEKSLIPCTVLDPFFGAGTTGLVADRMGRDAVGIELNEDYCRMARKRIKSDAPLFAEVTP